MINNTTSVVATSVVDDPLQIFPNVPSLGLNFWYIAIIVLFVSLLGIGVLVALGNRPR